MDGDRLRYRVVDVFGARPFTGNPLAVVFGADGLSTPALQALAREFNLSETVFVLPPDTVDADYRARIFTPAAELPFAGHPTVGTAWILVDEGRAGPGRVVLSCGVGLVAVEVAEAGGPATLDGATPTLGDPLDPAPLLAAVGLTGPDLAGPAPRAAGAGLEFAFVAVRPDAVARARPDLGRVAATDAQGGIYIFSIDGERVHARAFPGAVGLVEDPATGSAALGLGVYLVASGLAAATGSSRYVVAQGAEIGRPSMLACSVQADGGVVTATSVTGSVVPIAAGEIRRPPD